MTLTDYLTTFTWINEREKRLLGNISQEISNLYDSAKQLYNRTPMILKAGALIGVGVLGTLAYQKAAEPAKSEKNVWVSYHHGGSGDAKDMPYDYSGYVTTENFERIQADRFIKINDVEFGR